MAEYIEREALLKEIAEIHKKHGLPEDEEMEFSETDIRGLLLCLPTAEVEPVRHGRWEVNELGYLMCSNCAWVRYGIPLVEHYPYCPNCGARMDGGADNED